MTLTRAHDKHLVRLRAAALLAIMALGSISLWTVIPLICLRLASLLTDHGQAIVLIAIAMYAAVVVILGRLLYGAQARYYELTGSRQIREAAHAGHLRSISEERKTTGGRGVLDVMLALSAVAAVGAAATWFFLFASNPNPPNVF
ncbi:MAG: hypothetical protein WDZ37_04000 [Solirubrobacterales bacterium]